MVMISAAGLLCLIGGCAALAVLADESFTSVCTGLADFKRWLKLKLDSIGQLVEVDSDCDMESGFDIPRGVPSGLGEHAMASGVKTPQGGPFRRRLLRKPTGDQRSSLRHVPAVCSNIASVHRQAIHAAGATTPSHTSASTPTEYVNLFENPVDHHEVDEREKYDTLPRPKSVLVHDPHVPSYAASARQPQDQLDIENGQNAELGSTGDHAAPDCPGPSIGDSFSAQSDRIFSKEQRIPAYVPNQKQGSLSQTTHRRTSSRSANAAPDGGPSDGGADVRRRGLGSVTRSGSPPQSPFINSKSSPRRLPLVSAFSSGVVGKKLGVNPNPALQPPSLGDEVDGEVCSPHTSFDYASLPPTSENLSTIRDEETPSVRQEELVGDEETEQASRVKAHASHVNETPILTHVESTFVDASLPNSKRGRGTSIVEHTAYKTRDTESTQDVVQSKDLTLAVRFNGCISPDISGEAEGTFWSEDERSPARVCCDSSVGNDTNYSIQEKGYTGMRRRISPRACDPQHSGGGWAPISPPREEIYPEGSRRSRVVNFFGFQEDTNNAFQLGVRGALSQGTSCAFYEEIRPVSDDGDAFPGTTTHPFHNESNSASREGTQHASKMDDSLCRVETYPASARRASRNEPISRDKTSPAFPNESIPIQPEPAYLSSLEENHPKEAHTSLESMKPDGAHGTSMDANGDGTSDEVPCPPCVPSKRVVDVGDITAGLDGARIALKPAPDIRDVTSGMLDTATATCTNTSGDRTVGLRFSAPIYDRERSLLGNATGERSSKHGPSEKGDERGRERPNLPTLMEFPQKQDLNVSFDELELIKVIGGGGFGQVYQGVWRGTPVAVKVLVPGAQRDLNIEMSEDFMAEVRMLAGLRHPNVCLFMGACMVPSKRAIVTELLNRGSLWEALRSETLPPESPMESCSTGGFRQNMRTPENCWPWSVIVKVAEGVARGMNYLHRHKPVPILHRDLKSANLLLDESLNVKICDFGLARLKAMTNSMTGNCGTVQWMAPEVLASDKYTETADVYSYGIVCWELLTRACPYEGMSQIQVAVSVLNDGLRPEIPDWCPSDFRRLIKKCWHQIPNERPAFSEILKSFRGTSSVL